MSEFDRVRAAELLTQNPLFLTLMDDMKTDCVNTWRGSTNPSQREEQWLRLRLLGELEAKIKNILESERLLADRQNRAERLKRAER